MSELFIKQAAEYAEGRPSYPSELFEFIASKTPCKDLAWDVGTGSGQAARHLAGIFKNVIATDTSPKQLAFGPRLPNIRYQQTPPTMSAAELERDIASQSSIDVVTIAQAIHWFDLPIFYQQVKWVLKKPHGVIAAWCYTTPEVNDSVDAVFQPFYTIAAGPYLEPPIRLVDEKYKTIDFPFEPVNGADDTGPFDQFVIERLMDLDKYFTYLRSWSAYQTAREKGVELLSDDVIDEFTRAWTEDAQDQKVVKFPIYLRIGRVGNI
ncbi:putative methyltransferase DDB_G0268948 [Juglans microcarpa x Juglans regia]|uniref:putative methyltransferase DDB_G0268948 n=1 Tax=Juglans microcarpa x Juglans regia TaxID=2249226 RepID=UPI001B7EA6B8|nr:putative methyltransferase DDB_G0268948 [Juglans microcarpa x Juglans regia]